ncbi:MAG: tetratricopeptide repeat protein [Sphingomicrobium sp.]
MSFGIKLATAALLLSAASASVAQNQPSPEQRIQRLENQIRQLQGRVFVKGQPADTAGYVYEPAATQSSVTAVNDRLAALERQMADILRQGEENGHRLGTIEADLAKVRTDQGQRIATLERRADEAAAAAAAAPVVALPPNTTVGTNQPVTRPRPDAPSATGSKPATTTAALTDPGEDAYSEGFRLWQDGQFDAATRSLRAFVAAYPKHRRVSFANNLIGRSLLDSGQAREAAAVLLANYRANENGERAPDSLYYLGQSLMKLGQPGQACKAYAELEDVYRGKIRPDLAKLLPPAKSQAGCS